MNTLIDILIVAMLAVDIWCGEVKTHLEAAADPQVRHLGAITHYDHPTAGRVKVVGPAVKLSETPAAIDRPAPLVPAELRLEVVERVDRRGQVLHALDEAALAGLVSTAAPG